jgi:hypothetical protein
MPRLTRGLGGVKVWRLQARFFQPLAADLLDKLLQDLDPFGQPFELFDRDFVL